MTQPTRRTYLSSLPLPLLLGVWGDDDGDGSVLDDLLGTGPTRAVTVFHDEADDRDAVEVAADRLYVADAGAIYQPDDDADEWSHIPATGPNPDFETVVIDDLRTKQIGVSANQSTDLSVDSATETTLAIDDTAEPYFDDFGELDADNNKIVLQHGSHHEIVAHALLQSASSTGKLVLRIKVNGVVRALAKTVAETGEDATAETSVYLKLDEGDEVTVTVEHSTGSTETFPGNSNGNYVSCIRQ